MAQAATTQVPASNPTEGPKLTETRRGKVLLGQLSPEFLRLAPTSAPQNAQIVNDGVMAQQFALQQQQAMAQTAALATANRLTITIVEAKLNKNYGVTRMDPYCRIIVGSSVYETATAQNGAKLPFWGKTIAATVNADLDSIRLEVYDERAFSIDNRIAWGRIDITESIKKGNDDDDWWPLSGKLGEDKEGMVHLKLSWKKVQQPMYYNAPFPMISPQMYAPGAPVMMMPGAGYFMPPGQQPGAYPQPQPQGPMFTDQDLQQVKEMFPNIEDEVIKTVLEASRGNKDAAINSLLSMEC